MMHFRRILLILMVMIFMTSTLSAEAATSAKSAALEPWTTEVVDKLTGGYVGRHVSIDHYERDGRAYVSYYDVTNKDLKLAYQVNPGSGNCPGNANWKCVTVDDSGNDVGKFSSIDVVAAPLASTASIQSELTVLGPSYAKIGISYYDDTNDSLKFALRTCTATSLVPICSWHITEVDDDTSPTTPDIVGRYTSFNFGTDVIPVIYYNVFNLSDSFGRVQQAYLPTGNDFSGHCGAGWTCEVVARGNSTEFGTDISADGGRVVFYDGHPNYNLMVASSVSADTNTCGLMNRWNCRVIDGAGDVGKFASMVYVAGHPMQVAYYDRSNNGRVKYAIERTSGGGTTCVEGSPNFNCFEVDTIGVTGSGPQVGISLTLDAQGKPIIAYQDFHEDVAPARLKLARPASAYGNLIGNCGELPPGYDFYYWECRVLDSSGHTDVNEGDYAAVSVSPAGLATVAYYEDDGYNYEGHLKVAQQHFETFLPIINK